MTFFERLRALFSASPTHESSEDYRAAIRVSNDLVEKMRADQRSNNPVTALMADVWLQRHNIPYLTTVYEAVQEVDAAVACSDEAQRKPQQ